jgi:hypothetical protein
MKGTKSLVTYSLGHIGQCAISVSILVIVSYHLWMITYNGFLYNVDCFLVKDTNNLGMCSYAYGLGSWSILAAFAASIISCCLRDRAYYVMNNITYAFLSLWWIVGASVITAYGIEANNADIQEEYWRNVVIGLCWANSFVCLVIVGSGIYLYKITPGLFVNNGNIQLTSPHQINPHQPYVAQPYQPQPYFQQPYQPQPYPPQPFASQPPTPPPTPAASVTINTSV